MKGEGSPSDLRAGRSGNPQTTLGLGAIFDVHIIVDWSSRNAPSPAKPFKDAIWWAIAQDGRVAPPEYARTRGEAIERLSTSIDEALAIGARVLVGFDFPFGYPKGVAEHLTGTAHARTLWDWIDKRLEDRPDNRNNRYDVASEINRNYPGDGPMWGRPESWDYPDIPTLASARHGNHPPERRLVEEHVPNAKTVWQLAYAGSVGSQILVGLPAVKALQARFADRSAIWPFETGLSVPEARVVFAEIYPSLLTKPIKAQRKNDEIMDAAQVRVTAGAYHRLDRSGGLAALFEGAPGLSTDEREQVEREEAWILGAGHEAVLTDCASPQRPKLRYERDPAAIYRQSFATVAREARLDRFPEELTPLVTRLIHSCGMVEIADRLAFSERVMSDASLALKSGAPVLCDCEMVRSGIIQRNLPTGNELLCTLNISEVPGLARELRTTRSAAAVELWKPYIEGAIVAIGNAPTALFHLLERLDAGWPRPAAILGFPVGFIGAAESKAELARDPRGCEFIALKGRKGGSAMASAAVNAIAAGLEGHG